MGTLPQLLQGQNHLEGHWGDRDAQIIFLQQVLQIPERHCQGGQGAHESCSTQLRDRHNCHTSAPSLPCFPMEALQDAAARQLVHLAHCPAAASSTQSPHQLETCG